MIQKIQSWVNENKEYILDVNRKLVSIPSQNKCPYGDELEVQKKVEKLLTEFGFETDLFLPTDVPGITEHEAYLNGRVYEERPNVVGRLRGIGGGKSLIFSGHMDTVPLGNDPWKINPFEGKVVDDKQYGLGIYDMKSGMAAAMMAAKCLRDIGYQLNGDLIIECVVDEEFGGANGTLACRLRGYEADAAIIPEPTNLTICPVNQGGVYYRITFQGRPGRAYGGEKLVNPVFAAARFLDIVQKYHEWRNKDIDPMFTELVTMVQVLRAGNTEMEYSDRTPSTCSFDVWIQFYPGVTEEEIYNEFSNFCNPFIQDDPILSTMPPTIEKKLRFMPGSGVKEDHPILDTLVEVGKQVKESGLPYRGCQFACDSFMFNLYSNTPAVILGPSGGSAHAPDEYINISDFLTLIEVYTLTIANWCGVNRS